MEKILFQPNMPVRMALKYADGKTVEGRFGDQEYYTLTDGRCMYVNPDVAAKINQLELRPGEPFEICKYWSGKKGESPQWDVRRVDPLPKDRIAAGAVATCNRQNRLGERSPAIARRARRDSANQRQSRSERGTARPGSDGAFASTVTAPSNK
jgi:hypothetical protein